MTARLWMATMLIAGALGAQRAHGAEGDAPPASGVKAGQDGFTIQTEDGNFKLKLTGFVQGDARVYLSDAASAGTNAFLVRRVRPILQGTVGKYFDFNLTPDFGGGQAVIQDAFLDARFRPQLRLKVGKFKGPVGLELLQSDIALPVTERGLPQDLVPNRDIGVQLHGDLAGGVVYYQAGLFDGVADGASLDTDLNDAKDFEGRVFVQPFKNSAQSPLKGLGLGFAATTGKQIAAAPSYKTVGQLTFFRCASNVLVDGTWRRLAPQASFDRGPLRLIGEWVSSEQQLRRSFDDRLTARSTAWQGSGSVVLTGEAPIQGLVTPKSPFDPTKGTWGALEIAARYGQLEIDPDVFGAGYADPEKSARRAQEWGVALNWHLNRNVKYVASFDRTTFTGGAASGANRKAENALFFRAQVVF